MPIQNWDKFQTWVKREKIVVPPHFYEALNPIVGDDEKVRAVGTKLVAEMCRKILGNEDIGIKGLHIYTLNLEKGARMLLQELQLEGRRESIAPFPWRPSLTPHRRSESIRPIFWANRVHSYLSRSKPFSTQTARDLTDVFSKLTTGTSSRMGDGETLAVLHTEILTVTRSPSASA